MTLLVHQRKQQTQTLARLSLLFAPSGLLLLDVVVGDGRFVKLGRFVFRGDSSERLLQPFAGLQATAAAVAFGLNGRLALGRDDQFDHAGHAASSKE
jgi:hypothetical protein